MDLSWLDWKAAGVLFALFVSLVNAIGTGKVLLNDTQHIFSQLKTMFKKIDDLREKMEAGYKDLNDKTMKQEGAIGKLEGRIEGLEKRLNGRHNDRR
jgi:uncharacterized coiled-coil DUF342 family protein